MDNDLVRADEQTCPKRLWVLLTLSDDELVEEDGSLPPGLQFHLSRCDSCRAVAERLLSASSTLAEMSSLEPDIALAEAANARVLTALSKGAQLTGRVDIPDEPEPASVGGARFGWHRFGRYVAAATVFVAVGLYGLSSFVLRQDDDEADYRWNAAPGAQIFAGSGDRGASGDESVGAAEEAPTTDPVQVGTQERVADAEGGGPSRVCIRRHHSHIVAAMSDDPQGAQAAVVLPDTAQRNLGWGRVFDRPRTVESTKAPRKER